MTLKYKLTALAVVMASSAFSAAALASSWKIASGPDLGIRQIFEDAGTLVLQFESEPAGALNVTTPAGEELTNQRRGRYVVLTTFTHDFLVSADAGADRIVTEEIFRQEAGARRAQREREARARKEEVERQARVDAEHIEAERIDAERKAASGAHMAQRADAAEGGAASAPASNSPSPSAGPTPPPVPPTPTPACTPEPWGATVGSTLHDVIEAWTQKAGWHLVWQAEIDYPISAPVAFTGCYADAISALFGAYTQIDHPFEVQGMTQQKTLVVTLRK